MKFILEDKDVALINDINKDIEGEQEMPLFINQENRRYYIEFECTDIAKANAFVINMISRNPNTIKEIKDTLGIKVTNLNYCHGDSKLEELKNLLKNMLEQLEHM